MRVRKPESDGFVWLARGVLECRWLSVAAAALLAGMFLLGCGSSTGSSHGSTAAAVTSSTVPGPAVTTSPAPPPTPPPPPPPWAMPAGGPLTSAVRADVARQFAPRLRFNAWHNDGNLARQNRNEDFFPAGIGSFLTEIESGNARVVVTSSNGAFKLSYACHSVGRFLGLF